MVNYVLKKDPPEKDSIQIIDATLPNVLKEFTSLIITSRSLFDVKATLSYTQFAGHLVTDGTYKILGQKCPLLIAGTTDRARRFHPFAIMITRTEKTEDYEYFFKIIQESAKKLCNIDSDPKILVAYSADEITSGFKKAFDEQRVHCHERRNVRNSIACIKDQIIRSKILRDIDLFQNQI